MMPPVKARVPLDRFNRLINHGPVTLVSSRDEERRPVLMACAWTMPCRRTPPTVALAIGEGSHTGQVIRRVGKLVVNVPGAWQLESVSICGSQSGADTDKWKAANLTPRDGRVVAAPWVVECIGHLECVLAEGWEDVHARCGILLAEVRAAWADEASFADGRWLVEHGRGHTLHHLGGSFFTAPGELLEAP